jgi:hypothetical protein
MQFNSIREYFYRCYSTVMLISLIPIVVFSALYLQPSSNSTSIEQEPILFAFFSAGTLVCWLTLAFYANKKIKSLRNRQGLREKLEKYFGLTIVRFLLLSIAALVLALGFFLAHNDFFTIGFMINLLLSAWHWPSPSKVSKELRLRGDEREMVYHKRDVLS